MQAEVLDEPEHRVVLEAALLGGQAELRHVLAARVLSTGSAESATSGSVK